MGRKPKLRHLRVLGCEAMIHISKEKRDKWDAKTRKLIFIGYAAIQKEYNLIDNGKSNN